MSLERIVKMIPPPLSPVYSGATMSWKNLQKAIGITLPSSLDQFGRIYGSGHFQAEHSIQIFNVYDPGYISVINSECETYLGLKESSPEWCPYDCFPNKNGIFPVASSDVGVQFYVLLRGEHSRETVVFNDRSNGYVEFPMSIFEFFFEFLCNNVEPDYFDGKITFRPEKLHFPNE